MIDLMQDTSAARQEVGNRVDGLDLALVSPRGRGVNLAGVAFHVTRSDFFGFEFVIVHYPLDLRLAIFGVVGREATIATWPTFGSEAFPSPSVLHRFFDRNEELGSLRKHFTALDALSRYTFRFPRA